LRNSGNAAHEKAITTDTGSALVYMPLNARQLIANNKATFRRKAKTIHGTQRIVRRQNVASSQNWKVDMQIFKSPKRDQGGYENYETGVRQK